MAAGCGGRGGGVLLGGGLVGESGVILDGGLVEGLGILGQIGMRAHVVRLVATDNGTGPRRARSAREEHDARSPSRHGQIQKGGGHTERTSRAPRHPLVRRHRPRILAHILQYGLQSKGTLRDGHQESLQNVGSRTSETRRLGLSPSGRLLRLMLCLLRGAQELAHASRGVLAVATKDVGLGTAVKAELVHLHVGAKGDEAHQTVLGQKV
eukprot:scaffold315659_cov45-Attheya_sp.AAC.1